MQRVQDRAPRVSCRGFAARWAGALLLALLTLLGGSVLNATGLQGTGRLGLAGEAYFRFDQPPNPETFVIELLDPVRIQQARDILSGAAPSRMVIGTIVKERAGYNLPWSYYLDPASIMFVFAAVEGCDASIRGVEEHLAEVCGSFLPGCRWCPWGSRLLAEVTPPPTGTPTLVPRCYMPIVLHW